jgi:hypothetical protein
MSKNVKDEFYNKENYYETRNLFVSNVNKANTQKIIDQLSINNNEMWRKINNINDQDIIEHKISNNIKQSNDINNLNLGCTKCGLGKYKLIKL